MTAYGRICPVAQAAFSSGAIRLEEPPALTRAFPSWLLLNTFAGVAPERPPSAAAEARARG
jgi:hypothetical protein